jgi:hypothetical protein
VLVVLEGNGRGLHPAAAIVFFELDLGGEAVAIAPDRQNRQLPAAIPVSQSAVLHLELAVNLDPVPLPGMANIGEQQVGGEHVNLAAKLDKHNKKSGTGALATKDAFAMALAQGYCPKGLGRRDARAGSTAPMRLST